MEKKALSTIVKHATVNFLFHGAIVFAVTGIAAIFEPIGGLLTVEINSLNDAVRLGGATGTFAGLLAALLSIGRESDNLNPYELSSYIWTVLGQREKSTSKRDFGNGEWYNLSKHLGLYVRSEDSLLDYLLYIGD